MSWETDYEAAARARFVDDHAQRLADATQIRRLNDEAWRLTIIEAAPHMTQQEIGRYAGISQQRVGQIINDQFIPKHEAETCYPLCSRCTTNRK